MDCQGHFQDRSLDCLCHSWQGEVVHSLGTLLEPCHQGQMKPKAKGLESFRLVMHLKEFRENKKISDSLCCLFEVS